MKEKTKNCLKQNWFKISLLIIIIIVISGAFYWYEWRPTKIKERCSTEAHFDMRAVLELDDNKRQEFINNYYDDCLMRFGLEK